MNNNQPTALAQQSETVELAQTLQNLTWWGSNNVLSDLLGSIFPGLGSLSGIVFFFINPLWLISSLIFSGIGTGKLKRGDLDGARNAIGTCRLVNWILILIGLAVWSVYISSHAQTMREQRKQQHTPEVQVIQNGSMATDGSGVTQTPPPSPSIRAEMRQALTGGHVLQIWNTTSERVTCVATLNSPELRKSPTHEFTLEPGAKNPQELGVMQFGHRIKKKPRCSVTILVKETGEEYKFTP